MPGGVGQHGRVSVVAALIVASEIGFWVVIAIGLALRYLARRPRAGAVVLALVPVIDLVLLVAVAVDLHRGSPVTYIHQIAGLYLGVSLAFGPSLVRWADAHAAHLLAHAPRSPKAPKSGRAALRYELHTFGRWLVAAVLTLAVVALLAFTVADEDQGEALFEILPLLALITAVWLVTGPIWVLGSAVMERPRSDRDGTR